MFWIAYKVAGTPATDIHDERVHPVDVEENSHVVSG
jgi:hypothetical protein